MLVGQGSVRHGVAQQPGGVKPEQLAGRRPRLGQVGGALGVRAGGGWIPGPDDQLTAILGVGGVDLDPVRVDELEGGPAHPMVAGRGRQTRRLGGCLHQRLRALDCVNAASVTRLITSAAAPFRPAARGRRLVEQSGRGRHTGRPEDDRQAEHARVTEGTRRPEGGSRASGLASAPLSTASSASRSAYGDHTAQGIVTRPGWHQRAAGCRVGGWSVSGRCPLSPGR
jgi:hypothetical protein